MTQLLAPGVAEGEKYDHVRTMFEEDNASAGIGMVITHIADGEAKGHFTIRPDMCNGHKTAQGGYLFTFADSLFAGACNSTGNIAVAAQVGIHYIAPAREGDLVEGHAIERRTWGRNGITDVTLTVNGNVIAEFRGTSRVVKAV